MGRGTCCGSREAAPDRIAPLPRALLIANPKSRSGGDPDTVAGLLRDAGLDPLCPAMDSADAATLIRAHTGKIDRVVLAGGDGTVNAAAPALLETRLPFAIIPLGTGNDLARTLGIPEEPAAAARVAAEGRLRAIDVGLANDVPFFNVASIGFGVDLTHALTRDAKRRWGKLGYAVAAMRRAGADAPLLGRHSLRRPSGPEPHRSTSRSATAGTMAAA